MLTVPLSAPALCPDCHKPSDRTPDRYDRVLADLPWQGQPVNPRLRLRRFQCRNPGCPRRTFSERVPEVASPRARRLRRLEDLQQHLSLALGGSPAAPLAQRLAMPASPSTFLRMVRAGSTPVPTSPRVIDIDEWAWRRGRRYGTIIVYLERNAIVDLLPGREVGQVADWLRLHPRHRDHHPRPSRRLRRGGSAGCARRDAGS